MQCFTESGRLALPPEKEYKETHGKDLLCITLYKSEQGYLFSVNLKAGLFIKSFYPHTNTLFFNTPSKALEAASNLVKNWAYNNRGLKRKLKPFTLLEYKQLELDF